MPEYAPPPVIASTAGNFGAFTDHVDALPQPVAARDPVAYPAPEPAPAPAVIEEPAVVEAAVIEAKEEPLAEPAPRAMDHSDSYFDDKPLAESMSDYDPTEPTVPPEFAQAVEANVPVSHDTPEPADAAVPIAAAAAAAVAVVAAEETQRGEAASYYNAAPPMPVPELAPAPAEEVQGTNGHAGVQGTRGMPQPYDSTVPPFGMDYSSPDIWAGAEHVKPHEVWAAAPDPVPTVAEESGYHTSLPIQIPVPIRPSASIGNGNGSIHSFSSGIKYVSVSSFYFRVGTDAVVLLECLTLMVMTSRIHLLIPLCCVPKLKARKTRSASPCRYFHSLRSFPSKHCIELVIVS